MSELQYAVEHGDADVVAWIVDKQPGLQSEDEMLSREVKKLMDK